MQHNDPGNNMMLSPYDRHHACGVGAVVTSSSYHASHSALEAITKGGNALDAYIVAALVQCVVEHGSTSLCGCFGVNYYAVSSKTRSVAGWMRGVAKEDYSGYSYKSADALSGRGLALPGYVEGVRAAHAMGGRLSWPDLFDWAIHYAEEGVPLSFNAYCMARMGPMGSRYPEGAAIWMDNGRYKYPGEIVRQPVLANTLKQIAEQGAEYFYEGEFATHFVEKAKSLGGKHTLADMSRMLHSAVVRTEPLEGTYRGYQLMAPYNAFAVYVMHLTEAADIQRYGSTTHPEAVYVKARILEEAFARSGDYHAETHDRFIDPQYAIERISAVLTAPLRTSSFDLLGGNTNFLAVRDGDGNVAWSTHSINTSQMFGAGHIIDGVYASFLMNEAHARGGPGAVAGFITNFALYKDGRPAYIAGSPGHGFFHGPYQVMVNFGEFGLEPLAAVEAPRFGYGIDWTFGKLEVEGHHPEEVFSVLQQRGIQCLRISPAISTGMVGAMQIRSDGMAFVAQDTRRDGLALAA